MQKKTVDHNPYRYFASVYDQDDHIEITEAFFKSIKTIIKIPPKSSVLDLGCGSGLLTKMLSVSKYSVIAVDNSTEMLKIAKRRCRKYMKTIKFVNADITLLPKFNCKIALACGDIINHLSSSLMLEKVFKSVKASLLNGGVFVFDTLNRFCFEEYWRKKCYYMESKNGDLVMDCDWNPIKNQGIVYMTAFVKKNKNKYFKYKTKMFEYHYSKNEIRKLLYKAGFSKIKSIPWSPWKDQIFEPSLDRFLWIAKV